MTDLLQPAAAVAHAARGICPASEIVEVTVFRDGAYAYVPGAGKAWREDAGEEFVQALLPWTSALGDAMPESWHRLVLELARGRELAWTEAPLPDFAAVERTALPAFGFAAGWPPEAETLDLALSPLPDAWSQRATALLRTAPDLGAPDLPLEADDAIERTRRLAEEVAASWAPWFSGLRRATLEFRLRPPSAIARLSARRDAGIPRGRA